MPLTEDFTFQLGDSGITLNTSPSLPFVDITKVVGLSSTPYRETERQHEGVDGGFMDVEFEKGRHVILEGTIYADSGTMEDYLDDLKEGFATSTSLVPLYFKTPGQAERVLFVKPLGIVYDWDAFRRIGAANCQFKVFAEDPRIYTSALQTVNIDVNFPTDITGFDFGAAGNVGGNQGLLLPGSGGDYASTPDTGVLDISGDLDVRFDGAADSWASGGFQSLISKYTTTGPDRAYWLSVDTTGFVRLIWDNGAGILTRTSTIALSALAGRLTMRATLDVDNGAAGHTVTFYTGPTVHGPWTQFGNAIVTAGTTTIRNSAQPLEIGSRNTGSANLFSGTVYEAQVRSGINGTIVANPNFVAQANGASSFADTAGRTWTVNGNADIVTPASTLGFDFDFGFGADVVGNGENIVVGGNRPTPPIFVITANGTTTDPRILNLTTNRELRFDITLNDGDTLHIDPQRRTVLLNSVVNRRSALIVDEWFFLEPGTNFIGYRSSSADSSVLSVLYRDAWR